MNSGSTLGALYALQAKTSRFFFKKFTNFSLSSSGSLVLIWKYLSSSFPMTILSSSSHDTKESKEDSNTSNDCYEVGVDSNEPTLDAWCLITATIHCVVITWHPSNSPTPSSVGYFNFTYKVEDMALIVWSHGLAKIIVWGE